ncbi:MAG: site-2 protease family protein [Patescibacteria group bacterium]
MENAFLFVFQMIVVLFSVIVHEVSHGVVAERLGDPTARLAGRITLNPIKHIDPFGSIFLPVLLGIAGLPMFGWANPVPYNPRALKNPRVGAGKIAAAGPATNFLFAVIFAIIYRTTSPGTPLAMLFAQIVIINIALAVFNLLPLPPLDGSKVLFSILPDTDGARKVALFLERYGFYVLLVVIFFGGGLLAPIIGSLFRFFTGASF